MSSALRHKESIFWILLAVAAGSLLLPIWIGPIPPMPDVGAHVANADVWAKFDRVELYKRMFELRTGLIPNTLSARFASLLHPMFSTIAGIRLYMTLALVGTVAGLIATARTFGRSKWVVFLALPFLWNTALHSGMVNFMALYPFFFASLALAGMAARTGDWEWGVALGATTVASFFAHGLGPPLCASFSALVIVVSVRRPKHLGQLASLAPASLLWFYWKAGAQGSYGVPGKGIPDMLVNHSRYQPPLEKVRRLVDHGFNATTSPVEVYIFAGIVGLFILWMGISKSDPDDRHTLVWVTLALWAGFWVLPSYYAHTNIATRVGAMFFLTAALLPRPDESDFLSGAAVALCALTSIGFGIYVTDTVDEFHDRHLRPVAELSERIEPQSRVDCFALPGYNQTSIRAIPLKHNCPGLIQAATSSFGGNHFPRYPFNPVGFRDGYDYEPIDEHGLDDIGHLQMWDYLVTDESHPRPDRELAELVTTVEGRGDKAPEWHLYRVRKSDRQWSAREVGSETGGAAYTWSCPKGHALAGYHGRRTHKGTLSNLTPVCREIRPGVVPGIGANSSRPRPNLPAVPDPSRILTPEPLLPNPKPVQPPRLQGARVSGPMIGHLGAGERGFEAVCPEGKFMVGLKGVRGDLVRDIAVRCSSVKTTVDRKTGRTLFTWLPAESHRVGSVTAEGEKFSWSCPHDSVVTGALGRNGQHIDAVGIGCQRADELTEMP